MAVNTTEICKELKISRSTLQRWLKEGLPIANEKECVSTLKQHVFDIEEVKEWIRKNKIKT